MVTFRAIASLTKRSDSWRMASFDIAGARGFRTINSPCLKKLGSSLVSVAKLVDFERLHRAERGGDGRRLG
jgi:hypothetical protein